MYNISFSILKGIEEIKSNLSKRSQEIEKELKELKTYQNTEHSGMIQTLILSLQQEREDITKLKKCYENFDNTVPSFPDNKSNNQY